MANSIIEKYLLHLRDSSSTFNGNIRRLHGLCRLQKLKLKLEKHKYDILQPESNIEAANEFRYIKQIYKQAKMWFKKDGENQWGLALTYLQTVELSLFAEHWLSEKELNQPINTKTVSSLSGFSQMASKAGSNKQALFGNNTERNLLQRRPLPLKVD